MILGFRSGQVDYLLPGNHGNWYNLSHGLSGDGWDWTSWALWWTMPVSVRWHTLLQGQRLTNQSFGQSLQQMRGTVCLACQAWASRPAKAFSTYTTLQVVFMKWSIRWMLDVAGLTRSVLTCSQSEKYARRQKEEKRCSTECSRVECMHIDG